MMSLETIGRWMIIGGISIAVAGGLILLAVIIAIAKIRKDRKSGSCCGGCSGCSSAGHCGAYDSLEASAGEKLRQQ